MVKHHTRWLHKIKKRFWKR